MAATFRPDEAFGYAQKMVKHAPILDVKTEILQDAASMIWTGGPFSWTMGTIGPVTLALGDQDVVITLPADFQRLYKVVLASANTTRDLRIVTVLPSTDLVGLADFCAYYLAASVSYVRLNSKFPSVQSTETWKLRAFYKLTSPDIRASLDQAGALVMDDSWYWVYREAVLYYAYKYADDPRAGGAQITEAATGQTQTVFSGQLAIARAAIASMRIAEPVLWETDEPEPKRKAS